MVNCLKVFAMFTATLCIGMLCAQAAPTPAEIRSNSNNPSSPSPAAYVYVSSTLKGGTVNEVEAWSAAPDGRLTPLVGSPFQEDVTNMAVTDSRLFAVNRNGFNIDAYSIESNGALRYMATTNLAQSGDCNTLGPLFLDHTGATLYDMEFNGSGCANNTYVSFAIDKSTGKVNNIGNTGGNRWLYLPATFTANNLYAFTASCINNMYWGIWGYKRESSGALAAIDSGAAPPTPPQGYFYCPSQAAADPADHVAISMQPVNQQDFSAKNPAQLATYTVDAQGNITTNSTESNMPRTSVASITDINMSPSGKLLAVAGTGGLEVFHFNGASPITQDTGLLTTDEVDQIFWDQQNHLYAISRTAGKLFVFTVTPTEASETLGSPYAVNQPQNLIVRSE